MHYVRPAGVEARRALSHILLAYGTAGLVVAIDMLTKRWAAITFGDGPQTVIPGVLTFRFAENPGAAFSMFQNAGPLLGVAAVIAVGFRTSLFAWTRRRAPSTPMPLRLSKSS